MKTLLLILSLTAFALPGFGNICNASYKDIVKLVEAEGFVVTSTTGGRHNTNSKHYRGKAVDVSVRRKTDVDVETFIETMRKAGYLVRDERVRPLLQRVWGGPHLHISVQDCVEETLTEEEGEIQ